MNLKSFFERKPDSHIIHYEEQNAIESFAARLLSMLLEVKNNRPVIFVCIGTDRSTGDSLGPLIGTLLEDTCPLSYHIYGTLEEPVHAVNLEEKLNYIKRKYEQPYIIGIDACLGRVKSIGNIQLASGPVKPGAGVKKELPEVGESHITGVVNVSGFMEFFVLQNTRLHLVMSMAKVVSGGITLAFRQYTLIKAKEYKKPDSEERSNQADYLFNSLLEKTDNCDNNTNHQ